MRVVFSNDEGVAHEPGERGCGPRRGNRRRSLLKGTAGAAILGMSGLGAGARAEEAAEPGAAVKNGRIKQSIVHWCFEKYWPIDEFIKSAKSLGCGSIELLARQVLPGAQGGRAHQRHRPDRHEPRPAVREGVQQPQVPGPGDEGHARGDRRLRRVWLQERDLLHRVQGRHPRRRGREELRRGLQADRRPRREEGRHALPGDAQLAREHATR